MGCAELAVLRGLWCNPPRFLQLENELDARDLHPVLGEEFEEDLQGQIVDIFEEAGEDFLHSVGGTSRPSLRPPDSHPVHLVHRNAPAKMDSLCEAWCSGPYTMFHTRK